MKILFLNANIDYAGASKIMTWLANVFTKHNHKVTFVTFRSNDLKQHLSKEITYRHFPLEPFDGKGKYRILKSVLTLRRFILKEKFDLAIGFLSPAQVRLSLACYGLKTKLLFSLRGDPHQKSHTFGSRVTSVCFRRADYYVFQTFEARKCFSSKIQNRSCVIANPIKPLNSSFIRTRNITKRIVCVARLDIRQKRQDLLISAFNRVCDKFPEYVLEFYGDGEDENILKSLASFNSRIIFRGRTLNIAAAIENAALFVLSSDFEGIPNALLEAMSLGVPCISTNCSPGGAAMLIRNGENGLLVQRNNVTALAEAIEFMLSHPAESETMGNKAKEVNKLYSESEIASQWLKYIEKIDKDI